LARWVPTSPAPAINIFISYGLLQLLLNSIQNTLKEEQLFYFLVSQVILFLNDDNGLFLFY